MCLGIAAWKPLTSGRSSGGSTERGQSTPQSAAVLVSYSASVLGELWPFPHPCLTGASRRTYHKARLLLAMRPIASWHAASGFFKTSVCEGIQLPCCCPNWLSVPFCSLPWVFEHIWFAFLLSAYFGGYVLSQVFSLQNICPLGHGVIPHLYPLMQQSHFDTAPFYNIGKNWLSRRCWMDNENLDLPFELPWSTNSWQERMIA